MALHIERVFEALWSIMIELVAYGAEHLLPPFAFFLDGILNMIHYTLLTGIRLRPAFLSTQVFRAVPELVIWVVGCFDVVQ